MEWEEVLPGIGLYYPEMQSHIRRLFSYLPPEAELSRSSFDL